MTDCCEHPDVRLLTEDGYECLNCGRMFGHRIMAYHPYERLKMYGDASAERGRFLGSRLRNFAWAYAAKRPDMSWAWTPGAPLPSGREWPDECMEAACSHRAMSRRHSIHA